jgi:phage baseplate assembly protein W
MAFEVKKIHPLDLQPRKAVGVSLPFSAKDVFTSTYTTKDALKANLINFLLTDKGERVLNPNFGIGLRSILFEQATQDTKDQIDYLIRKGISDWFPELIIKTLTIVVAPDTNTVTIYMKYNVNQTNIQDELLINFEQ